MLFAFAYLQQNKHKTILWITFAIFALLCCRERVFVVFCALFIVLALFSNFGRRSILNNARYKTIFGRIIRFLGDTSYSVYLLHKLILFPVLYFLFHKIWFIEFNPGMRLFVAFLFVIIPLYLISYLLFRLIELPCIQCGRRILKKHYFFNINNKENQFSEGKSNLQ